MDVDVPQDGVKKSSEKGMIPWVERYRPTLIEEIVGNSMAVSRLQEIASLGNMPNLIFSGPPGTGVWYNNWSFGDQRMNVAA